jgi:Ca-activated chloride channel family protein
VRPNEDIEQKVSSLYNKITSPVLTAIKVDVDGPMLDDMYPAAPLPDLFAGSQLIITGRFRDAGKATITLTGQLNGARQTYTFSDLSFPANAGGQPFISRLWATRKIGALLNQIRLNGETPELVNSVVKLSVRYGIITPYTSYLIQEEDINARRDGVGGGGPEGTSVPGTPVPIMVMAPTVSSQIGVPGEAPASGEGAVDRAKSANDLESSDKAAVAPTSTPLATATAGSGGYVAQPTLEPQKGTGKSGEVLKTVNDRTFIFQKNMWVDTLFTEGMKVQDVVFLSDDYFKLLTDHPEIKDYLAIGERVLVVVDNIAYNVKPE